MSKLNVYILLDRSKSMENVWGESLEAINAYIDELKNQNTKARATVATFDYEGGFKFDIVRDAVPLKHWHKLTSIDAKPRGWTPLLDALGKIIYMAEEKDKTKTVIVVMTDGDENYSKEITKEVAAMGISRCKEKGWQVLFLGADFDAFGNAAMVGVSTHQTINMTQDNYVNTLRAVATSSALYSTCGMDISFDEDDRTQASK